MNGNSDVVQVIIDKRLESNRGKFIDTIENGGRNTLHVAIENKRTYQLLIS